MRPIAAAILSLCIYASSAQNLIRAPNYRIDARTKVVTGLLKRQSNLCDGLPSGYTTCPGELGSCCETGASGYLAEQCCQDGSCCPGTDASGPGTKWTCDAVYGCCFYDAGFSSCPGGASPAAAPSASAKSHAQKVKNVTVSATDPRITYSPQWDLGTSSCDASQQSKKTVNANQTLSFNTQGVSGSNSIYVDFTQQDASFDILIDGQSALSDVGTLQTCAPNGPITLSTSSAQIQIVVNGLTSKSSGGFFEFNNFIITKSSALKGAPCALGIKVIGALLLAAVLSV